MPSNNKTILALDIGHKRIGVASANTETRLPQPLKTLDVTDNILQDIADLVAQEEAAVLVAGLPRSLAGDDTAQTQFVREFVQELTKAINIPVQLQDEALTSRKAEEELAERGVPYNKGMVDALAATFILSDFLAVHTEV